MTEEQTWFRLLALCVFGIIMYGIGYGLTLAVLFGIGMLDGCP